MILLPNIGFILTDVEYKEPARKYAEFQVNVEGSTGIAKCKKNID